MGYILKSFLVKPSSTYPAVDVPAYFVGRINAYQVDNGDTDYYMGDVFDAPRNRLLRVFSDYTAAGHGGMQQSIVVYDGSQLNNVINQELLTALNTPEVSSIINSTIQSYLQTNSVSGGLTVEEVQNIVSAAINSSEPQADIDALKTWVDAKIDVAVNQLTNTAISSELNHYQLLSKEQADYLLYQISLINQNITDSNSNNTVGYAEYPDTDLGT